jgi:hypothetical protein
MLVAVNMSLRKAIFAKEVSDKIDETVHLGSPSYG